MDAPHETPSERVLATPELLELILIPLLSQLRDPLEREDPRSQKTRLNANVLLSILSLRLVNRTFDAIMTSSVLLKRGLFLAPDHPPNRSWSCESAGQLPAIPVYTKFCTGSRTQKKALYSPIKQGKCLIAKSQ